MAAGALPLLDVATVHPYTGHNRSWEEQGTVAALSQLKAVIGDLPLLDSESAWWSDGPANIFSQADKPSRAQLWMRVLGMGPWSYFLPEGGYGDYGLSYSLIQSDRTPDNYVKPAAAALQVEDTQLRGRSFLGMVDTAIPHAYAAPFGALDRVTAAAFWSRGRTTSPCNRC